MATLLEEQGRSAQAEALRESLGYELEDDLEPSLVELDDVEPLPASDWADASVGPDHARRLRVVATLESWLHNIRHAREHRDAQSRAGGSLST
jgi:hypothetical protein